ncbi:hypothetical protein [Bacillus sp. FJAT-22090]|uniref:hypothetical protein n=1 Tax=Bacillus sp. FJAT-22090 TaxID=1581038 RepID=UPI00119F3254|nr:hypothetical protein [Bacillus sp. FJAT-22090]
MRFKLIDGKMVQVDEKVKVEIPTWTFPTEPTVQSKRKMKNIPFATLNKPISKGFYAKSSLVAGLGSFSIAAINPQNGIFWETFMIYLFPWMIDIANCYCILRIAQAFYQENRGGSDKGTSINAVVTHGKWLLLFHLIPFFVKFIDQLGLKMVKDLG